MVKAEAVDESCGRLEVRRGIDLRCTRRRCASPGQWDRARAQGCAAGLFGKALSDP